MSEHNQAVTVKDGGTAISPTDLLSQAIQAGAGIEQLEKLMALQERWEARQAKKAFDEAMAAFQAEKPEVRKNKQVDYVSKKTGTRTKYSYAQLSEIQKAIDPVLARFGLSYSWRMSQEADRLRITCVVSHVGGHSQENHLEAPADDSGGKNSIQQIGSTVTYLSRYTLCGAFGIAPDDDDDGQEAPEAQSKPQEDKVWLTEEQFKIAMAANAKQIKGVIAKFTGPGHAMKKQYREALQNRLTELQNS